MGFKITMLVEHGRFLVLYTLIGFIIGLSVILLTLLYNYLWNIFLTLRSFNPLLIVAVVMMGLILSYITVQFVTVRKEVGCGTDEVVESYHYHSGFIPLRDTLSRTVASAMTIGFGGSAGLEGPSILLGGGLASNISQKLNLKPEEIRTILLAGASAGLAAIFKAPLTGILFALEIPYQRDIVKEAFIPASIASVTSYLTFILFMGGERLFPLISTLVAPSPIDIIYLAILGLLASLVSVVFIKVFKVLGRLKGKNRRNQLVNVLVGGLTVGFIGLFFPQVLGLGYNVIHSSVIGELYTLPILILSLILILKIAATSLTLNFGGSGGLFIPSIYVGAVLGVIYINILGIMPNETFVMAAIAAVMAASNKTLLTSVAFVAETCGPSSIIPALIAACVSFFTSGRYSFYENQLLAKPEEEEEALSEAYHLLKEKTILRPEKVRVKAADIMTPNPVVINQGLKIKDVLKIMKTHRFRKYPVVDENNSLIGYVTVEDILALSTKKWDLPVNQMMVHTPLRVIKDEDLISIVEKMVETGEDHAYVISDYKSNRLIGVIAGVDALRKILEAITS